MPQNNSSPPGKAAQTSPGGNAPARQTPPVAITAAWLHRPATQAVFKTLNSGLIETRAVGGAVRNALLGEPATDIDFATTAHPEDITVLATKAGMNVHPTGIAHGTVTVVCNGETFEVTTLREDVSTDGRRATVAFTTNWTLDAKRRDFTINALYCDSEGTLFDPLDGYADLENRKVRFIGDPHQRIREDYLRILRFFRFHATFSTPPIDKTGLAACINEKSGLASLSGERIQSEILRLLVANGAIDTLAIMHDAAILELALQTPPDLKTIERLSAIEAHLKASPDALLRLAAMAVAPSQDTSALANHLKLSNAQAQRLANASQTLADDKTGLPDLTASSEHTQRKALYRLGPKAYSDTCLLQWARSNEPVTSGRHENTLNLPNRWQPPPMPFSGADLIAAGLKPGPDIGRALSQFETWWIDADFPGSPDLLKQKLMEFANQQ